MQETEFQTQIERLEQKIHQLEQERDSAHQELARMRAARALNHCQKPDSTQCESEQHYRNLFHNNKAVMLLIDPSTTKIVDANSAACAFYGYSPKQMTALSIMDINTLPPERLRAEMQRAKSIEKCHFCFEHRLADGTIREVEVFTGPIVFKGRKLLYSIVHDITERKASEVALRDSELFHRQLLDSIPGMVFTTRADGYCNFQNHQWVEFTGVPVAEHLGDGWNSLLHPEDQPRALAAWRNSVKKGEPYDLEYRVRRYDGNFEWFKVIGRPIRNNQGQIVRWFGTALNIDQLVWAQEELKRAKSAAEKANRAKSEFLANMSHEIRTPMSVFLPVIEHLLQSDMNTEHRQMLDMADKSAKHLRALIDDILDFSRIEAGQVTIQEERVSPSSIVDDVINLLRGLAKAKNLDIHSEIEPQVPETVSADRHRLNQVLVNLIGNAIKFTDQGEIKVSVGVEKGQLLFAVSDTGPGIPEDRKHLLFRSFSQLNTSTTRKQGGTGLGLAICKGLVEMMGGKIWMESLPRQGSTFFFTHPLSDQQGERFDWQEEESSIRNDPKKYACHILLAEDDSMIQNLVSLILEQKGCRLDMVPNGKEAVERMRDGHYDLILMDMHMPEMDGLEAAQKIRNLENLRGVASPTRIIALTADVRREVQEAWEAVGINTFLPKPLKVDDLLAAIDF